MYAVKNADENDARMMENGSCGMRETGLLGAKKLTVPQAAKFMGLGQTKLRELLRKGNIPVIRIMGKILLLERDLEAFMQRSYGPLKVAETKPCNRLPPLPKDIAESALLKKAMGGSQ